MKRIVYLAISCLLLLPYAVYASVGDNVLPPANTHVDRHIADKTATTKLVYIDGKPDDEATRQQYVDSIRRIVSAFYYDQFRSAQDPDSPTFLFLSKDANLTLGIGGGVRMRAFYDWNGAMPTTAFSPINIAIPADPASGKRFNATPSGTYFNIRAIGHNSVIGSYCLYIEADFTGYQGRDLKLKKSYAMVRDFTIGYATTTFSDPAALPAVIDAAGPNNKFSASNVLVRYMPCFKKHWYVAASVETPQTAIDVLTPGVRAASNMAPDFAAFLQYEWARGQHIRLSGVVRSLSYLTTADSRRHNLTGWGVQLSGVARPETHLSAYFTANYGHGYAGLGGDLINGAYDLVADPSAPGTLYAPASFGWCAGLQYNFRPDLFATVAASETRYLPRDGQPGNEYKYGIFGCANLFWMIMPRLTVAAEFDWGKRANFSGETKCAERVNLSCMFTF